MRNFICILMNTNEIFFWKRIFKGDYDESVLFHTGKIAWQVLQVS